MFSKQCNTIFEQAVADYHQFNDIDKNLAFAKNQY